ncbi:MAG TPA: hypothetical protein PKH10_08085 [bacterium]|nr:hypothetical protein [bacterium]
MVEIPKFSEYYPSIESMNAQQRIFYKDLETKLNRGEFQDVDGNISYLFVYVYTLLAKWRNAGFESLHEFLIYLSELYKNEQKFSNYCLFWAHDCLLGQQQYEEFLEKTEPKELFGTSTHQSNLRLNIQKKLNLEANPIDILLMVGGRKSKILSNNQALYKEKIIEIFDQFANPHGGWFSIFDKWSDTSKLYSHSLFNGVPIMESPKLTFGIAAFYSMNGNLEEIKKLSKEAENRVREELGIPQVGQGWVSETELFRKLESSFTQTQVLQHGQPPWLGKQHFDIWFPNWKIAVEYHGQQHYEPVEFFGGVDAFNKNRERDERKANLAKRHGVKMFVVNANDDQAELVKSIIGHIKNRKVLPPR